MSNSTWRWNSSGRMNWWGELDSIIQRTANTIILSLSTWHMALYPLLCLWKLLFRVYTLEPPQIRSSESRNTVTAPQMSPGRQDHTHIQWWLSRTYHIHIKCTVLPHGKAGGSSLNLTISNLYCSHFIKTATKTSSDLFLKMLTAVVCR